VLAWTTELGHGKKKRRGGRTRPVQTDKPLEREDQPRIERDREIEIEKSRAGCTNPFIEHGLLGLCDAHTEDNHVSHPVSNGTKMACSKQLARCADDIQEYDEASMCGQIGLDRRVLAHTRRKAKFGMT
jgi:hypothetical protein